MILFLPWYATLVQMNTVDTLLPLSEPETQWAYLLNERLMHEQKIEKYWLNYDEPIKGT